MGITGLLAGQEITLTMVEFEKVMSKVIPQRGAGPFSSSILIVSGFVKNFQVSFVM